MIEPTEFYFPHEEQKPVQKDEAEVAANLKELEKLGFKPFTEEW